MKHDEDWLRDRIGAVDWYAPHGTPQASAEMAALDYADRVCAREPTARELLALLRERGIDIAPDGGGGWNVVGDYRLAPTYPSDAELLDALAG